MTEAIIQTLAPRAPRLAVDNCPDSCPEIWIHPPAWHDLTEHFANVERTKLTHRFPRKLVTILTSVTPLSNSLPRTEIWDSFELFSSFLSLPQYSPEGGLPTLSFSVPYIYCRSLFPATSWANLCTWKWKSLLNSLWKSNEFLGPIIHWKTLTILKQHCHTITCTPDRWKTHPAHIPAHPSFSDSQNL